MERRFLVGIALVHELSLVVGDVVPMLVAEEREMLEEEAEVPNLPGCWEHAGQAGHLLLGVTDAPIDILLRDGRVRGVIQPVVATLAGGLVRENAVMVVLFYLHVRKFCGSGKVPVEVAHGSRYLLLLARAVYHTIMAGHVDLDGLDGDRAVRGDEIEDAPCRLRGREVASLAVLQDFIHRR